MTIKPRKNKSPENPVIPDSLQQVLGVDFDDVPSTEPGPRPVNVEDIERFLDGTLDDFMADDVTMLISEYVDWRESYRKALRDRETPTRELELRSTSGKESRSRKPGLGDRYRAVVKLGEQLDAEPDDGSIEKLIGYCSDPNELVSSRTRLTLSVHGRFVVGKDSRGRLDIGGEVAEEFQRGAWLLDDLGRSEMEQIADMLKADHIDGSVVVVAEAVASEDEHLAEPFLNLLCRVDRNPESRPAVWLTKCGAVTIRAATRVQTDKSGSSD